MLQFCSSYDTRSCNAEHEFLIVELDARAVVADGDKEGSDEASL
jgi:hypothetical protein